MCEKNGLQIPASPELLFRQVHPNWLVDNGVPSTQSFWPWGEGHECCLSVDRESKTCAADSHSLFTAPKPNGFEGKSVGVWGLSTDEVRGADLSAWDDPVPPTSSTPANDAHGVIDFSANPDEKVMRKIGKKLKVKAVARGRLYP